MPPFGLLLLHHHITCWMPLAQTSSHTTHSYSIVMAPRTLLPMSLFALTLLTAISLAKSCPIPPTYADVGVAQQPFTPSQEPHSIKQQEEPVLGISPPPYIRLDDMTESPAKSGDTVAPSYEADDYDRYYDDFPAPGDESEKVDMSTLQRLTQSALKKWELKAVVESVCHGWSAITGWKRDETQ